MWSQKVFWATNTTRVCTMLLQASAVLMALCLHIAEERKLLIWSTHTFQTGVGMCSVDVLPVQLGIAFTASTADTSSARTSQCTVGGFTTRGLTLLGLSWILCSQSSMSRQQLMSMSSWLRSSHVSSHTLHIVHILHTFFTYRFLDSLKRDGVTSKNVKRIGHSFLSLVDSLFWFLSLALSKQAHGIREKAVSAVIEENRAEM